MDVDQQQQQQNVHQHVRHEVGVVSHEPHHVAAGSKVHAGAAAASEQQQGIEAEPDATSPTKAPKAKRQKQQQQQQEDAGQQAAAEASVPASVRLQLISNIDQFKQECEKYPVYCTVKPVLYGHAV